MVTFSWAFFNSKIKISQFKISHFEISQFEISQFEISQFEISQFGISQNERSAERNCQSNYKRSSNYAWFTPGTI